MKAHLQKTQTIQFYMQVKLSGCLVEIFGDTKSSSMCKWEIVVFEIERELSLLDLRGDGALRAGSVAALCKDSDHSLSQKWSRYFYQNPFLYSDIDGLIFGNAHNDELALALYELPESSLKLISNIPLASKNLRYSLLKIASDLGFVIEPAETIMDLKVENALKPVKKIELTEFVQAFQSTER
jgi:hypothetical protein